MVANASTIVTVDLIDEITMTAGPILAMTIGIDVIIDAMIDVTTIVAMTATTGATTTEVIVVMIAMMIVATTDETTDVMIDVAETTTVPVTTIGRSGLHHHHPKGATQWCILEGQLRDQLHRWMSPSDQKQLTDSIKCQGDRARQHRKPATSVVV
jgi:tRNA A37 threonylcarbamoyladenosine dehydratase